MPPSLTGLPFLLNQLHTMYEMMDKSLYACPLEVLNGGSIGQHVRHIHDFYKALAGGLESGVVNYNHRERDEAIETSFELAIKSFYVIMNELNATNRQKSLSICCSEGYTEGTAMAGSSVEREMMYGFDHAIHHMALIRIGFESVHSVKLPVDFGVAGSTLSHYQK